jgi:uncharacterized protein YjbI with pentapeptide repeats
MISRAFRWVIPLTLLILGGVVLSVGSFRTRFTIEDVLPLTIALVALSMILISWFYPEWSSRRLGLQEKERIQLVNDTRRTSSQFIGGSLVLLGLYFTWQTVQATYRSAQLSQESQITDRYYRAIQAVGSDRPEVRLGAIYALERIARESSRDSWPIMQVLTAYVRERARWSTDREKGFSETTADVQAVMNVLRNRDLRNDLDSLDLSAIDLRKADLEDIHLRNANLTGAHLDASMLIGADLRQAHLDRASLRGAFLSLPKGSKDLSQKGPNWRRLFLYKFFPSPADLSGASLIAADLGGAQMRSVLLADAVLICVDLRGADLSETDLSRANLKFADLRGALLDKVKGLTDDALRQTRTDSNPNVALSCP